ncbi:hypothetical protein TMatcc_009770, partial [Talaromyces marneffei ATCC 18224]
QRFAAAEIFSPHNNNLKLLPLFFSLRTAFSSQPPSLSPSAPPALGLVILLAFTCQARENSEELDSLLHDYRAYRTYRSIDVDFSPRLASGKGNIFCFCLCATGNKLLFKPTYNT